jgi:hypothetical protein
MRVAGARELNKSLSNILIDPAARFLLVSARLKQDAPLYIEVSQHEMSRLRA